MDGEKTQPETTAPKKVDWATQALKDAGKFKKKRVEADLERDTTASQTKHASLPTPSLKQIPTTEKKIKVFYSEFRVSHCG